MTNKTSKKLDFLINLAFAATILALVFVFFKYLFNITAPFLIAFFVAILLQKPIRRIDKKTNKKAHAFWSILLVFLCIAVIIIPIILIISQIAEKAVDLVKYCAEQLSDLPTFLTTLEEKLVAFGKFLPDAAYKSYCNSISQTFAKFLDNPESSALSIDFDTIKNGLTTGVSGVYSVVKNVPSVLLAVVIAIIACIFMTKDYDRIVKFIQIQLPHDKRNVLVELKQIFNKNVLKIMKAYGLIMLITFCELLLGFGIMELCGIMTNPYFVWIAAGTTIFDILPVAGSGGILIPWALFSFVSGNYKQGIGLLILYGVITVIRQYIEPRTVGNTLGIHPLITLIGMYLGLKLFGFWGMIAVPMIVVILKAYNDTGRVHLWNSPNANRN